MNLAAAWPWRVLALAVLAVAGALLLYDLGLFLSTAGRALEFTDELDYGEGIVWQQAILIGARGAYGDIAGVPMIVFHYPPVYHLLTLMLSSIGGLDMLTAGRLLSLAATMGVCLLGGGIVARILRAEGDAAAARICAIITALMILTLLPVRAWSMLMRVDMVAVCLSIAGLSYGIRALGRPGLIHGAALCFVAAVYTKQTSIAAPAALFLAMLSVRPRVAVRGIATCLVAGLIVLGLLAFATDGGFVRHILFYNINRFDPAKLQAVPEMAGKHAGYLALAGFAVLQRIVGLWARRKTPLGQRAGDFGAVVLLCYLATASATLILVAKSGSNINYFLEWTLALAMLGGLGLVDVVRLARAGQWPARFWQRPFALLVLPLIAQAWLAAASFDLPASPRRLEELDRLSRLVHDAQSPVISDDMVLLLRSGKPVVLEPAIAAELASTGIWDEKPFLKMIRAREFAFFVTVGTRGGAWFDSRYTPEVAAAMADAYPIEQRLGGYVVHWPLLGMTR